MYFCRNHQTIWKGGEEWSQGLAGCFQSTTSQRLLHYRWLWSISFFKVELCKASPTHHTNMSCEGATAVPLEHALDTAHGQKGHAGHSSCAYKNLPLALVLAKRAVPSLCNRVQTQADYRCCARCCQSGQPPCNPPP